MALQSLVQAQTVLVLISAFLGRHACRLCKFCRIIENLVDLSSIFRREAVHLARPGLEGEGVLVILVNGRYLPHRITGI